MRWVRPAIEQAQVFPLVGGARSRLYFYSLFVQSLFICSTFCYIFITCFSLFCFGCVLFSKIESFGLGLSYVFFYFCFVLIKLERGFQKNNLSSFNLVLIWLGYRGISFLSHATSLWFCDVSKMRWLVQFTTYFFPTGLKERLKRVKTSYSRYHWKLKLKIHYLDNSS